MFDPYNIYKREVHSSHSGQVIRKKIRRKSGKVYTNEELEDAIPPLRAIGYSVYKGSAFETQNIFWSDYYTVYLGPFTYQNPITAQPILFEQIWPTIKPDFEYCLRIDPLRVVNILFEIDLISFTLYGDYTSTSQSASIPFPNIGIFMFDPSKLITADIQNPLDMLNPTSNFHYSYKSINATQIEFTASYQSPSTQARGYFNVLVKQESKDNQFMNVIERRQPAIIKALREDDYQVFNPPLLYTINQNGGQLPATAFGAFVTFQAKMVIEHE